jgi:hypothetical protein
MTETTGWEDRPLFHTADLAQFLGGSEDSFTGLLLVLLQKADPGNVARIRKGFPEIVTAWETWNAHVAAPTPRQLREALKEFDEAGHRHAEWERYAYGDPGIRL